MKPSSSESVVRDILVNLSPEEFMLFGIQELAYASSSPELEGGSCVVRGADGQLLGEWPSFEIAEVVARQNGLTLTRRH